MIEIKNKTALKKHLPIIITAAILALLIIAYVIISAVINATSGGGGGDSTAPEVLEEIGESTSGNYKVAYPTFSQSEIEGLVVDSHNGKFAMYRSDDESYFFFCYEDENGDMQIYYPDIVGEESEFDYTDLYATEKESGLNIYKLTYLLTSVGTLYFDQRISLSDDVVEREKQLTRYGLNDEDKESLVILRTDSEGNNTKYTVEIGDKLLAGSGYYFRVDDRDYVYTSNGDSFDYALGGFEAFLHSKVVAEGLEVDNAFEPYLTTDYKQWKNTVTSYDKEAAVQALVKAGSKVTVNGSVISPVYDDETDSSEGGYIKSKYKGLSFDLSSYTLFTQYDRLVKALVNAPLGDYSSNEILATVITDTLEVEFGDKSEVEYTYTVTAIESILCEDGEYNDVGKCAGDYANAQMVRVTYNYSIDGVAQNTNERHAVIDLSDTTIAESARNSLMTAKVGEAVNIVFTVKYDSNTDSRNVTYVISEIALICEIGEDESVKYVETVGDSSIVTYRYYLAVDGKKVGEEDSNTVDLSTLTEGNYLKIKEALIGKSVGKDLNINAFSEITYRQSVMDFVTYSIRSIDYFVTSTLISSFEFVNASVRDSFYGESLYVNTLPTSNKYRNYALNSTSCETVVRLLGGINSDGTTDNSVGLSGTETVAIGLTPENMLKYGLYANTVYFELPRGIQTESSGSLDEIDDYTYLDTLGFTLYISDYDPEEKCRYIGSDMYNIVVKIEESGLDYLDLSFIDFWARRSLVMVNYTDIESISLSFFMEDIYGSYKFDAGCETVWILNGQQYNTKPESGGTEYEFLTVNASVIGENSGNKLTEYLIESGEGSISIANLYNRVAAEETGVYRELKSGSDTLGASYFKDMLLVLYNTYYTGSLTEVEQTAGHEKTKVMSFSFTVDGSAKDTYTYDFYRIDDRRVMVSLYNPGYDNEVSDFYISTFAFKKLVNNFNALLNGSEVLPEVGYWD